MKFIVAEKESVHGVLLVITDKNIMGKKFEEGQLQLDLTKDFYQGEEKMKEELAPLFLKARHLHLTGNDAVTLAVQLNYVIPERILRIGSIPHAQAVIG